MAAERYTVSQSSIHQRPGNVVDAHIDEVLLQTKIDFHLRLFSYYENAVAMPPKPESTFIEDEIELYSARLVCLIINQIFYQEK